MSRRRRQERRPNPQQLKMEGQAGEGPSAFAAGDVKQDYIGGDIGNGIALRRLRRTRWNSACNSN